MSVDQYPFQHEWPTQRPIVGMLTLFEDRYLQNRYRTILAPYTEPNLKLRRFIRYLVEALHFAAHTTGSQVSARLVVHIDQPDRETDYLTTLDVKTIKRGRINDESGDLCAALPMVFGSLISLMPNLTMPRHFQYLEVGSTNGVPRILERNSSTQIFNMARALMKWSVLQIDLGEFGWLPAEPRDTEMRPPSHTEAQIASHTEAQTLEVKEMETDQDVQAVQELAFRQALRELSANIRILCPRNSLKDQDEPAQTLAAIRAFCKDLTTCFLEDRVDMIMQRLWQVPLPENTLFLRGLIDAIVWRANATARLTSYVFSAWLAIRKVRGDEHVVLHFERNPNECCKRGLAMPKALRLVSIDMKDNVALPRFLVFKAEEEEPLAERRLSLNVCGVDVIGFLRSQGPTGIDMGTYGLS
ncbi:hypothetical protein GGS21DRAFT_312919 [Xylaria nigripes]|nr:hypothetical protein GGS21DRAFT_312919 [Xylaria nigripes]